MTILTDQFIVPLNCKFPYTKELPMFTPLCILLNSTTTVNGCFRSRFIHRLKNKR